MHAFEGSCKEVMGQPAFLILSCVLITELAASRDRIALSRSSKDALSSCDERGATCFAAAVCPAKAERLSTLLGGANAAAEASSAASTASDALLYMADKLLVARGEAKHACRVQIT
jgi:hypothetical protein